MDRCSGISLRLDQDSTADADGFAAHHHWILSRKPCDFLDHASRATTAENTRRRNSSGSIFIYQSRRVAASYSLEPRLSCLLSPWRRPTNRTTSATHGPKLRLGDRIDFRVHLDQLDSSSRNDPPQSRRMDLRSHTFATSTDRWIMDFAWISESGTEYHPVPRANRTRNCRFTSIDSWALLARH